MILGRGGHDITSAIVCALRSKISPFCSHTKTCKDWFFFPTITASVKTVAHGHLKIASFWALAWQRVPGSDWQGQNGRSRSAGSAGSVGSAAAQPSRLVLPHFDQLLRWSSICSLNASDHLVCALHFFFFIHRESRESLCLPFSLYLSQSLTHIKWWVNPSMSSIQIFLFLFFLASLHSVLF